MYPLLQSAKKTKTFTCVDCKKICEITQNQCAGGTGYAFVSWKSTRKICYSCCGLRDQKRMKKEDKICLYVDYARRVVVNWCGTLVFNVSFLKQNHIYAFGNRIQRTDAWFTDTTGNRWWGVCLGDMDLMRCKKLKKS